MAEKKPIDNLRIGVQIAPNDPFWVQVSETVRQELMNQIVPFEIIDRGWNLSDAQMDELSEEILSNDLDAFICMILPRRIIDRLLDNGVPVICVEDEIDISHPLFSSVRGWYDTGKIAAQFLVDELRGKGNLLCLTGNVDHNDNIDFSRQRMAGINRVLKEYPEIKVQVLQSYWDYSAALEHLKALLAEGKVSPPDAVLGLSDSLALAARNAGKISGLIADKTLIAGINGEPAALSEILKGGIQATVNIRAEEFAGQAVKIALNGAQGESLPRYFYFSPELVTIQNVAEISVLKLRAISSLPTRLVGINRKTEESRLIQYEISASINRKMAVLSDRKELIHSITELIRVNYQYDRVFFYLASEDQSEFSLQNPATPGKKQTRLSTDATGILGEVYQKGEGIFVADMRFSNRFRQDSEWPGTQSRVVLPVRFGDRIFGVLDLQSDHPKMHLRNELIGLQSLADQLGVALHNTELYDEAVRARAAAEKANQLKTRLLANVSHELRAPLNVIMGYSQAILTNPALYKIDLPAELLRDQSYIFNSGEHLIRLINDLLDVSRAEIGALEIFPETVSPSLLLREVFNTLAGQSAQVKKVEWRLELPENLPLITADTGRLRQILINLLNNASKFTDQGSITLGAEIQPPYLHLWVLDTGRGISEDALKRIFEPFATANSPKKSQEGIGLGLNITRRLVFLHHGRLSVESQPGQGSTFHVYLPLPSLSDQSLPDGQPQHERKVMLVISSKDSPNPTIQEICQKQALEYYRLPPGQDLESLLSQCQPVGIAWNLADFDPNDWMHIEQIRDHGQLNKVPFLVYKDEGEIASKATGITNILTKPLQDSSLYEYLLALRPENSSGPILVVDDDLETRTLYKEMLSAHLGGFGIVEAESGVQALELLKRITPSLIVLDLMMPNMDGFEVLENVRFNKKTRQVPVIVISGKILTLEDVQRLDYSNVIYQRKNLLTAEETIKCLKKIFSEEELLPQPTSLLVKQSLAFIQQNYQNPITREDIADAVGTSPSYLSRIVSQEIGITLWDCLVRLRMQSAKEQLLNFSEAKSITEIALGVGYEDPAYFCKTFKSYTGISPLAYRKQNGRPAKKLP